MQKTFTIAIQSQEMVDEYNNKNGTNFKATEGQLEGMLDDIIEMIEQCGDKNGWYVHDTMQVKVSVEYHPENK